MIQEQIANGASYQLLGPVRGLLAEVAPVLRSLETFRPNAVGVGISDEDLRGLGDHFVGVEDEPVVPLTSAELAEIRGLSEFGEVRVPNPSMLAVIGWARTNGARLEALDPSDDHYATMFADTISYVELVRRTVRERKFTRAPPKARSPDDYALMWDGFVSGGRGSVRFALQRDAVLVRGAWRLGIRSPRVSVVVDRERFARVETLLRGERPTTGLEPPEKPAELSPPLPESGEDSPG